MPLWTYECVGMLVTTIREGPVQRALHRRNTRAYRSLLVMMRSVLRGRPARPALDQS